MPGAPSDPERTGAPGRSSLLDELLQEILGEVSQEIRKLGGTVPAADEPGAPSPARPPAPAPPSGIGPDAPGSIDDALTQEERRAIDDLMRQEVYQPVPAAEPQPESSGPIGSLEEESPSTVDSSATQVIPPVPEGHGDPGILEVEDLIRMHLSDGPVPGSLNRLERATEPMADFSTVFGPVRKGRLSVLNQLDQWVISRGLAPYKRTAGIAGGCVLGLALAVVIAVMVYRNR